MSRKTRFHNASGSDALTLDAFDRFYTKTGWLSVYALGCGYMESAVIGRDGHLGRNVNDATRDGKSCVYVTLWTEGGVFHVRMQNVGNTPAGTGRIFWDSFDTLSEARRRFEAAIEVAKSIMA